MTSFRIALYQPDIAGNTGTVLRMAACLGLASDLIEPAGFDDRHFAGTERAGERLFETQALELAPLFTRRLHARRF